MTKQQTLFTVPPKPRQKSRKLMHVCDAGPDCSNSDEVIDRVRFQCRQCGHETGWQIELRSVAKRGVPCPQCNSET